MRLARVVQPHSRSSSLCSSTSQNPFDVFSIGGKGVVGKPKCFNVVSSFSVPPTLPPMIPATAA